MKNIYIILFFFLISCGYPDIDSVPDFKNLEITKEESIDLCELTYTDIKKLSNCIDKIESNQN